MESTSQNQPNLKKLNRIYRTAVQQILKSLYNLSNKILRNRFVVSVVWIIWTRSEPFQKVLQQCDGSIPLWICLQRLRRTNNICSVSPRLRSNIHPTDWLIPLPPFSPLPILPQQTTKQTCHWRQNTTWLEKRCWSPALLRESWKIK